MAPPVRVPTIERVDLPNPAGLAGLRDLAENLVVDVASEALRLFARIDPDGWARTRNSIRVMAKHDR